MRKFTIDHRGWCVMGFVLMLAMAAPHVAADGDVAGEASAHAHANANASAHTSAPTTGHANDSLDGGVDGALPVRELYVPFDDLHVLLEAGPRRVLLSREAFAELRAAAERQPDPQVPTPAALVAADYRGHLADERLTLAATLTVDVLAPGLHALPLPLHGVGLRAAQLDGEPAPLGRDPRDPSGAPTLFVRGPGRHTLTLDLVAPVHTEAARQVARLALPTPPATHWTLTAVGDVDIEAGAAVARRTYDPDADRTTFELVPPREPWTLVATLNGRRQRTQRLVVARSVQVGEVTHAYQKLHATVSLDVLHEPVDRLTFNVPAAFEVTDVSSPDLAQWTVIDPVGADGAAALADAGPAAGAEAAPSVLEVRLRRPVSRTVVVRVTALRSRALPAAWSLPRLEPTDVVSHAAIVGVLLDRDLAPRRLVPSRLIPIDTGVLAQAMPTAALAADPGRPALRALAAYYAPQADYALQGAFDLARPQLDVRTNLLLVLADSGQQIEGGLTLRPRGAKRFDVTLAVPAGWQVTSVTDADGAALPFDRVRAAADDDPRIRIHLPTPIEPGTQRRLHFHAQRVPEGWFDPWPRRAVSFPVFRVADATDDSGAIAVEARDDLRVRPQRVEHLTPLDHREQPEHGLAGVASDLAYRYDAPGYALALDVERVPPRMHARSFAFFHLAPGAMTVRYELVWRIEAAKVRQLQFVLPASTPTALSVTGLDDVTVKGYAADPVEDGQRRWRVRLSDPRQGTVRLAVTFSQALDVSRPATLRLPPIRAEAVAYQSSLVAVEGDAELDVAVIDPPRRVDVGELAEASHQPGRRLLGVYESIAEPAALQVRVAHRPGFALPAGIVQQAALTTVISPEGTQQHTAALQLRTRAMFLEVALPPGAVLWSATLDGRPTKPQRQGDRILLDIPAGAGDQPEALRRLVIVYETSGDAVGFSDDVTMLAPRLLFHRGGGRGAAAPVPVPVADLAWRVHVPEALRPTDWSGLTADAAPPTPRLAAVALARWLYRAGGGTTGPFVCFPALGAARRTARQMQSNSQLRAIHQSMVMYAQQHGSYPPDLGTLVVQNYITPEYVLSPSGSTTVPSEFSQWPAERQRQWVNAAADYVMTRPGQTPTMDGSILAGYEKPWPDSGGTSLVRDDNSTGFVPIEQARQIIEQQTGRPPVMAGDDRIVPLAQLSAEPGVAQDSISLSERAASAPDARRETAQPRTPAPTARPADDLLGVRSLQIDLDASTAGTPWQFRSLDGQATLTLSFVHARRLAFLAWAIGLIVVLVGLALDRSRTWRALRFALVVAVVATFVPLVFDQPHVITLGNAAFFGAVVLGMVVGVRHLLRAAHRWMRRRRPLRLRLWRRGATTTEATTAALLLIAGLMALGAAPGQAVADDADDDAGPPVHVPANAIVLPYDPAAALDPAALNKAKLLVPYDQYVALWNRAHPHAPIEAAPPAPYALAGATYDASLDDGTDMRLAGRLIIEVYGDDPVQVPLALAGAVLESATLDGAPARLSVAAPAPPAAAGEPGDQRAGRAPVEAPPTLLLLHVEGKGRHVLDLAVRTTISRRGGWRVIGAQLPAAPATALTLRVPEPGTDLRLTHVPDRARHETTGPDQRITTALGPAGQLGVQWRPQRTTAEVDAALEVTSTAVLDVQEDGLRVAWQVQAGFPRSQRQGFTLHIPADYVVEAVEGDNLRGWQIDEITGGDTGAAADAAPAAPRRLEVELLRPARDREHFIVRLQRAAPIGTEGLAQLDAPVLTVEGAALHRGELIIRRSPRLALRTLKTQGVRRTDVPTEPDALPWARDTHSPLGLRPYEAYAFVRTPFGVQLSVEPMPQRRIARTQTVLRLTEADRTFESRLVLSVRGRPMHRAQLALPEALQLDQVTGPGAVETFERTDDAGRRILTLLFARGQVGEVPIVLRGRLGERGPMPTVPLPQLVVLDVDEQSGDLVVQADPAFDVAAVDLRGAEEVLLGETYGWLAPAQRELAQVAIQHRGGDCGGKLRLVPRQPEVLAESITNIRLTPRTIEETILLDFDIRRAGIREVTFRLPRRLAEAQVSAPMLRRRTIEPVEGDADMVRVRLELQDAVMRHLRVLVSHDGPLTEAAHAAPIAVIETGRTLARYVVLENASRDELITPTVQHLEPVSRRQREGRSLIDMLGDRFTQAYVVRGGADGEPAAPADRPRLTLQLQRREAVQTAGARIGLAETVLVLDEDGAYRALQRYRIDNTTEQVLELALPAGAEVWAVRVAGEPVKPAEVPQRPNHVRLPLVKTAPGELDYEVQVKYAGHMATPGGLGEVTFPLIRTVNINVELSQARLYLPERYRWMDFGGTMRRVTEAGDYEAGFLPYQTKQLERLVDAIKEADAFTQARAAYNVRQLKSQVQTQTWRGASDTYAQNEAFQRQLASQAQVLKQAEAEVEQLEAAPTAVDNRARLNEFWAGQSNLISREVVKDVGRNFVAPEAAADAAQAQAWRGAVAFNEAWIESAQLKEAPDEAGQAQAVPGLPGDGEGDGADPAAALELMDYAGVNGQVRSFERRAETQGLGRSDEAGESKAPAQREQTTVEAYAQQLRARERGERAVGGAGGAVGMVGPSRAAGVSPPTGPTGLVSLDVALPVRGQEVRFTTPRGDVSITARAVSHEAVATVGRVIGFLLALVVLIAGGSWFARATADWWRRRTGGMVVLLLGIASVVLGVLPLFGVLALATGLAMVVVHRGKQPA